MIQHKELFLEDTSCQQFEDWLNFRAEQLGYSIWYIHKPGLISRIRYVIGIANGNFPLKVMLGKKYDDEGNKSSWGACIQIEQAGKNLLVNFEINGKRGEKNIKPILDEIRLAWPSLRQKDKPHPLARIHEHVLYKEYIELREELGLSSEDDISEKQHMDTHNDLDDTQKPGRRHETEDVWAWEEVNLKGRDKNDVFKEWQEKLSRRLEDPKRQFARIIKPSWLKDQA